MWMTSPETMDRVLLSMAPAMAGILLFFGALAGVWMLRRVWGWLRVGLALGVTVLLLSFAQALHGWVAQWQHAALAPRLLGPTATLRAGAHVIIPAPNPQSLSAMNPAAHQNPWVLVGVILLLVGFVVFRWIHRLPLPRRVMRQGPRELLPYPIAPVELGIDRVRRTPIRIEGTDRFINLLIVGSIGTGKTSRILQKMVYQDLHAVATGYRHDVLLLEPEGGFSSKAIQVAERLGVTCQIIDLRGDVRPSNVRFNPFAGGDVGDIVDNVRAVLAEQMGSQEGFFQNVQDDLVRTVIQVQVPLWPETDFLDFAELVTDTLRFRAICQMVMRAGAVNAGVPGTMRGRRTEMDEVDTMYRGQDPIIRERYAQLPVHEQSMVLSAARSFLVDTRTEQKIEHLEKVTKGLKIVVGEISTHQKLRRVLGKSELPEINLKDFLANDQRPGRLLVIVTGNRPVGNLFGKLFLVSLKMYGLSRDGGEQTRRPVYLYVDEYARYATASLGDAFAQGRKYRISQTIAIQTRAFLKLNTNRSFVDVVEGSCRNKVYFPAPAPEDAKFLQDTLGSITEARITRSENALGLFDARGVERKVSTSEQINPRFRLEDVLYRLKKDEAIFVLTKDNEQVAPFVGQTSYADDWIRQRGWLDRRAKDTPRVQTRRQKHSTDTAEPVAVATEAPLDGASHSEDRLAALAKGRVGRGVKPTSLLVPFRIVDSRDEALASSAQRQPKAEASVETSAVDPMRPMNGRPLSSAPSPETAKVRPLLSARRDWPADAGVSEDPCTWPAQCPKCQGEAFALEVSVNGVKRVVCQGCGGYRNKLRDL